MDLSLLLAQAMSGLSRGMMLFLIASGLSLIFGVMNILNFAHATLWLVGAYACYSFWHLLQDYSFAIWVAIPLAGLSVAALGWLIEVLLIRRVYDRELPEQLLLTYAMVLILGDLIKITWGVDDKLIERPEWLQEPLFWGDIPIDSYFIFVILAGFAVYLGLWWFLKKTRYGHIVRAAVYSREMVSALGIPIPAIYTGVFVLGLFIAGLAGGIQGPVGSVTLGMDMAIVIQAFCVVIIGGFGSLSGTLVSSIIVGEVYAFCILFWPDGALALIFIVTACVLIVRPWGLFGTPMRA